MKELPPTKEWVGLAPFFGYASTRYAIYLMRTEAKTPASSWTTDPILQTYRFCNVFREDDTTTRWIKKNIRKPLKHDPKVVIAMCACRFFNRISTLEAMAHILLEKGWDTTRCRAQVAKLEPPIVTSAYMLKTPAGKTKFEGIAEILAPIRDCYKELWFKMGKANTLRYAWELLREFPYVGNFMAYEIVTDLRHTRVLEQATDINEWASAGPGAARGLSRVVYGEIGHFNYHSDEDQLVLALGMMNLLEYSRHPKYWCDQWPLWEMREVEHTLCEFDKYERARLGQGRPKQLFRSTK